MRYAAAFLIALGLAAPPGAKAQASFSGPLSPGAFEATLNMGPIANTLRAQMQGKPQPGTGQDRAAAAAPQNASLRFTPSQARRKANFATFVAKTRPVDPEGAQRMAALFASTDIIAKMQAPLAQAGLRVDDLADAYAVWWINAWSAAQGHNDTPDSSTVAAVKAQAARALLATAAVRSASDAAKQEMAEALLIQAALIDGSVEQSKSNPALLKSVGAAVAQGAKGMGIDLSTMRLTRGGFIPAG